MATVPSGNVNWPPKSPRHALLSSPSGRKKLQRQREQGSPSPSPMRKPQFTMSGDRNGLSGQVDEEDEDEDEETLQLQLKAIEARLKLKKLQRAKSRACSDPDLGLDHVSGTSMAPEGSTSGHGRRQISQHQTSRVHVPLSPTENKRRAPSPKSPARALGIDKELKAHNVSLKRGSSLLSCKRPQPDLRHAKSLHSMSESVGSFKEPTARNKSFSERILESRVNDRERHEKMDKLEKSRSRGFGISSRELSETRTQNSQSIDSDFSKSSSVRGQPEIKRPSSRGNAAKLERFKSIPNIATPATPRSSGTSSTESDLPSQRLPRTYEAKASEQGQEDTSSFESFSGFHLSKRAMEHPLLTRTFEGKELFSIPRLLKTVKSPDYDPPDIEGDYVVFGILAWKSSPYDHKANHKIKSNADGDEAARSKFMVIRLTDLKWELDLFLFDTGFEQFWKLSLGTVIALLNPSVMPPKDRDTGRFSLKLCSSEDTVLEIGTARDLGFCKSVKKDGQECRAWIDKRKTEFCEFHVSLQLEKTRAGRMEVNTMASFGSSGSRSRGMFGSSGASNGSRRLGKFKDDGLRIEGRYHDRSIHETVYVAPPEFSRGRSAAVLLDEDDNSLDVADRGRTKKELLRKRKTEQQKERDLAKRLGEVGSGMGGEYMRQRHAAEDSSLSMPSGSDKMNLTQKSVDAVSLGLVGSRASDIQLNAMKRKRSGTLSGSQPMGWSGATKKNLLSPLKPSTPKINDGLSPVKKRARFMLENGIREPGRESIGNVQDPSEDDDELEII